MYIIFIICIHMRVCVYMYIDNNNNTEDLQRAHIHPAGCLRRESRNTVARPFSFTVSVLGSFTCITQHTGPTALRPIQSTQQLWLSVLLKDTSAATGQAGIWTHILTTPAIESNALDCSATTLHIDDNYKYQCHVIIVNFGRSLCLCCV